MRHLKSGRALGVKPAHRRAIMRNMVTSLLEHGQIRTTVAKAKELRKPLDHMITLGKQGDLAARRRALSFVKSKAAVANLFGELAERYKDRAGGYTRILRLGPRRGDGAELVLMMLVGSENDPFADSKQPRRRRGAKQAPKQVLEEVAEEVRAEDAPKPKRGRSKASSKAADKAPAPEAGAAEEAPAEDAEKAEETKPE
jgi:large subunit ribosomal protein L17